MVPSSASGDQCTLARESPKREGTAVARDEALEADIRLEANENNQGESSSCMGTPEKKGEKAFTSPEKEREQYDTAVQEAREILEIHEGLAELGASHSNSLGFAVQAILGKKRARLTSPALLGKVFSLITSFEATVAPLGEAEVIDALCVLGPLSMTLEKVRGLFLQPDGKVWEAYWGGITRSLAEKTLGAKKPGSYLVRRSMIHRTDIVVSFAQEAKPNVRHCYLRNAGHLGYLIVGSSVHVPSVRALVGGLPDLLNDFVPCPDAVAHNSALVALHAENWEKLSTAIWEESREEDSFVGPFCSGRCEKAALSPAVSVICTKCKTLSKHPASCTPLASASSSVPPATGAVELEDLLRRGAERFRTGQRSESEALFLEVLAKAEQNLVVHHWQSHPGSSSDNNLQAPPSRLRAFLAPTPKVPAIHQNSQAWCKCLACTSLRAKAKAQGNLGHILVDKKKLRQAVHMYERSLPILRELGMWKQEPVVLSSLTTCAFSLEDSALAGRHGLDYLGTITNTSERKGLLAKLDALRAIPPSCERTGLEQVGEIHALLREGDKCGRESPLLGLEHYMKARHAARCLGDDTLEVTASIRIGCAYFEMSRLRDAIVNFERSVLLLQNNNALADNRDPDRSRSRVELHNLALVLAKKATSFAGWATNA